VNTLDEEFEGTALNSDLWSPNYVHGQTMDSRLHATVPENILVGEGKASILIEKEDVVVDGTTYHYKSASFNSFGKFHQKYGYFEARIKVPYVKGLWPSFWMMPDRGGVWYSGSISTYNGGMEFDIMEILGQWGPGDYSVACHWDEYGADHQSWGREDLLFPSDGQYHVYAMWWKEGEVRSYVDGVQKASWTNARVGWTPEFLILDCEVGGWAGTPNDAGLPAQMHIDWVRAWRDAGDAELANEPIHDTYVRDGDYAANNFGIDDTLTVKQDIGSYNRQTFLQFDVSEMASAQEVLLSIVPVSVGSGGATTTLKFEFVSDDNWTETDTTWSNKPAGTGTVFATQTGGWTVGTPVEIDVTNRAKTEAAGDGVLSLRITSTTAGSQKFVTFGSHEQTDADNRPVLLVDP
jgi:beta-glucanase (GH16 family)